MPMAKVRVPWAMRWPNGVVLVHSASMWCGKKSPIWLGVLQPADIWCAAVLDWPGLLASEGFKVLNMLQTVTRPDNVPIATTRAPLTIDGVRPSSTRAAPRIGEHTAALRAEFGL